MDPVDKDRVIERLREELQEARDAQLATRGGVRFSFWRPVRRLVWWWLKPVPEQSLDTWGRSREEDSADVLTRTFASLVVGVGPAIALTGLTGYAWYLLVVPAMPIVFWTSRAVAWSMLYLDDDEARRALETKLTR